MSKDISFMKKYIVILSITIGIVPSLALALPSIELQKRLDKVKSFYSNLTQSVTNTKGDLIYQGKGEMYIRSPNLFNWHIISPDEIILISDGKTLWFYNPLLKQVTITWLNIITSDTPLNLITFNDTTVLNKYHIKQIRDVFYLIPKSPKNNLKKFIISISRTGMISSFTSLNKDGIKTIYRLYNQQSRLFGESLFHFFPSKDVRVDDQRE